MSSLVCVVGYDGLRFVSSLVCVVGYDGLRFESSLASTLAVSLLEDVGGCDGLGGAGLSCDGLAIDVLEVACLVSVGGLGTTN